NAGWLRGAAQMHLDFADDDEVALQHALALLAVYGYDRAHTEGQMEAGAIALGVLQRRPDHPGAAHYAIHAFDSREHAILALPATRCTGPRTRSCTSACGATWCPRTSARSQRRSIGSDHAVIRPASSTGTRTRGSSPLFSSSGSTTAPST